MGKKKVDLTVGPGEVAKNITEFTELLKKHILLRNCSPEQLDNDNLSGEGRLVWARNPGSVFWPALIATFEDKPEIIRKNDTEEEEVTPEQYRCVMFLEATFRYAVLGWKDLILVQEDNIDLQRDLVSKLNRFVVKKTWREEKPFREAVALLKKFVEFPVNQRQKHAFQLSLEKKKKKLEERPAAISSKTIVLEDNDSAPSSSKASEVDAKIPRKRESVRYTLRQIPDPIEISSVSSAPTPSTSRSETPVSNINSGHSECETLSDLSRKFKKRPKCGGPELKKFAENRFLSIDKSFKYERNDVWKCSTCLGQIETGAQIMCHELPHHKECLFKSRVALKDGSIQIYFKCRCCTEKLCFLCKEKEKDSKFADKCTKCDLRFHRSCLEAWPQAQLQGSNGPITCPAHFCHTCMGEQRVYNKQRNVKVASGKIFRCLECLSTYHKPHCLPAGAGETITGNSYVTCPRHTLSMLKTNQRRFGCLGCGLCLKPKHKDTIECLTCLQNFHASCVGYSDKHISEGLSVSEFGRGYKCTSCLWGLFPIYGQVIWFQQKGHGFWPARTLFPKESLGRLEFCKNRELGQYSIKYFGPEPSFYDKAHRTFPLHMTTVKLFMTFDVYQENVKILSSYDEAEFFHQFVEEYRDNLLQKPEPYYKRIERNVYRMVMPTKKRTENTGCCLCHLRDDEKSCTLISGCHNRDTAVECNDQNCRSKDKCQNRMFSQKLKDTDNTIQFLCRNKGWAVKSAKDFDDGDFIIEYCGEIINNVEMQYRANRKSEEDPLYILEIDKHTFIDAEYQGSVSRLINHSCDPNCRTEKYTSDGKPVVGVFAQKSILKGEELTFDYAYGNESAAPFKCHCGTENCRGYVGKSMSSDVIYDVVNPDEDKYDKQCHKCSFGGYVLCCEYEGCYKVSHIKCAGLTREPEMFYCPDHPSVTSITNQKRKLVQKNQTEPPSKKRKTKIISLPETTSNTKPIKKQISPTSSQVQEGKKTPGATEFIPSIFKEELQKPTDFHIEGEVEYKKNFIGKNTQGLLFVNRDSKIVEPFEREVNLFAERNNEILNRSPDQDFVRVPNGVNELSSKPKVQQHTCLGKDGVASENDHKLTLGSFKDLNYVSDENGTDKVERWLRGSSNEKDNEIEQNEEMVMENKMGTGYSPNKALAKASMKTTVSNGTKTAHLNRESSSSATATSSTTDRVVTRSKRKASSSSGEPACPLGSLKMTMDDTLDGIEIPVKLAQKSGLFEATTKDDEEMNSPLKVVARMSKRRSLRAPSVTNLRNTQTSVPSRRHSVDLPYTITSEEIENRSSREDSKPSNDEDQANDNEDLPSSTYPVPEDEIWDEWDLSQDMFYDCFEYEDQYYNRYGRGDSPTQQDDNGTLETRVDDETISDHIPPQQ